MNPFDLFPGPAIVILFPLFMLVLLTIIAPDVVDLDSLLRLPADPQWPRGVQEEEPVRWHVELLSRRAKQPATGASEQTAQTTAPARTRASESGTRG